MADSFGDTQHFAKPAQQEPVVAPTRPAPFPGAQLQDAEDAPTPRGRSRRDRLRPRLTSLRKDHEIGIPAVLA